MRRLRSFPTNAKKRVCSLIYLPSASLLNWILEGIHSEGFRTRVSLSLGFTKQSSVCSHRKTSPSFEMLQLPFIFHFLKVMAMPNHSKFIEQAQFPKRRQVQQMELCFQATIKCTSLNFFPVLETLVMALIESFIFNTSEDKIHSM